MTDPQESFLEEINSFLGRMLAAAGLDLQYECEAHDGIVMVEIHGPDSRLVVANDARLLYAINHLLNRIFYERSAVPHSFLVDCNQYRAARTEELRALARKVAEEVKRSGHLRLLDPMPASERRIVHMALAEEPGVRTESEGVGAQRRVVILPSRGRPART